MEKEEPEIIDLYELPYSELCSPSTSTIVDSILETLGPTGPGLLAITGVPNASKLRSHLLPLAPKLAFLDRETRKRVLKENNLGSDVPLKNPHRSVSSFAMQLKYANSSQFAKSAPPCVADNCQLQCDMDVEFKNLGRVFQELGFCMMELGFCLARICDRAIGGNELEQSLLESCAAKGRLIHYHSSLDALLLEQLERNRVASKRHAHNIKQLERTELNSIARDGANLCGVHSNLWQQWHYDYGIFTVLTSPLFLLPPNSETSKTEDLFAASSGECASPTGHTCLQIYDPNKKRVLMVKAPLESFIIQVGESADIISKGKLRATLHCVHRPPKIDNLSRETFVLFLQPAWTKQFSISDYPHANSALNGLDGEFLVASNDEHKQCGQDNNNISQEILKIVPPLSSRLKEQMTFAEFSRETTKQYYGGSGLQSNR